MVSRLEKAEAHLPGFCPPHPRTTLRTAQDTVLPRWGGGPNPWLVDPLPRVTCHPPALGDTRPRSGSDHGQQALPTQGWWLFPPCPNQERETALLLCIVEEAELDALKAHQTILFDPRSGFDKVKIQVSGFSGKTGLSGRSRLPGLEVSRHRLVQQASSCPYPQTLPSLPSSQTGLSVANPPSPGAKGWHPKSPSFAGAPS